MVTASVIRNIVGIVGMYVVYIRSYALRENRTGRMIEVFRASIVAVCSILFSFFAGNVISFFLFASPIPTFVKIYKNKTVEEFKPDPYLATIINCMLWVFYGLPFVTPDSILVVTINSVGLALEIAYITIFFIYAQRKSRIKVIIWILIELVFLGIVATCTLVFFHTHENRSRVIGILCIVFGVLMYSSPLTIMSKVIKTKSVQYMPFYLSLTNFLNGLVWVIYALIRFDLYILIGNGLGALSGALQLILYACYCKSTPKDDDEKKTTQVQLTRV